MQHRPCTGRPLLPLIAAAASAAAGMPRQPAAIRPLCRRQRPGDQHQTPGRAGAEPANPSRDLEHHLAGHHPPAGGACSAAAVRSSGADTTLDDQVAGRVLHAPRSTTCHQRPCDLGQA
jgi:hypothetical protein